MLKSTAKAAATVKSRTSTVAVSKGGSEGGRQKGREERAGGGVCGRGGALVVGGGEFGGILYLLHFLSVPAPHSLCQSRSGKLPGWTTTRAAEATTTRVRTLPSERGGQEIGEISKVRNYSHRHCMSKLSHS